MGCSSSSQAQNGTVSTQRRRLSVGEVNEGSGMDTGPSTEEKRGAIQALSAEDLVAMMSENSKGGRRFSIGSHTDAGTQSFSVKKVVEVGEGVDKNLRIGYTCRKGLKPESPNQDSWAITQVDDSFSIYAVYDGHGGKGHDVSNFVKDTVPKLILKDPRFRSDDMPAMLLDVFKTTQEYVKTMDQTKQLSAQMAGTTATVCIHDKIKNQLTVAHVADSTCVLGKYKDESKKSSEGVALTRDHKPDLQDERKRIEKAGGRVVFDGYANYRVYAKNGQYPGLNMSRCLGDLLGHQDAGCSAEPETSVVKIEPLHNALLLCSDGVWEFIKPSEAINIVMAFPPDKAQDAADKLAKEAWDRWITEEGGHVVDDITVVLVHLNV